MLNIQKSKNTDTVLILNISIITFSTLHFILWLLGSWPWEASRPLHEAEARTNEAEVKTHETEVKTHEAEARFLGLKDETRPRGLTSLDIITKLY